MTKKKTPQTIEECNAELELTQKKIRQYENRSKMLDRRLAIEKRKERNHRICPVWRLYGKHRAGAENHDGGRSARTSCIRHRKDVVDQRRSI